jgi:hypothetical protein
MPTGFRDVTDEKALRRISPVDILGEVGKNSALEGYARLFPTLQAAWKSKAELIARIRDLHDVSKHRRTIFSGGKVRSDAPDGFYEMLGVPDGLSHSITLRPMAEVFLQHDPKLPEVERKPQPIRKEDLLENIVPSFSVLINETGGAALADALANVPLKEKQFRGA